MMRWALSSRFDRRALPLADRHYNRRKIGSPQFVPPGRCVVLLTGAATALWVTSWPFARYVRHAWAGAWVNSLFRNESDQLSSALIVEAVAATCAFYGEPPPLGIVSFVDANKTRRKRDPGRCYLRAGWEPAVCVEHRQCVIRMPGRRPFRTGRSGCAACQSMTKGGLHAFQLQPSRFPRPVAPIGHQAHFPEAA